ncbi:MAG: hypothetical protein OXF90_09325, partial [Chloroflexi bacterium]|nr:hypothetical protein [Chloroflexota bacterium]
MMQLYLPYLELWLARCLVPWGGEAVGADIWVSQNISAIENESIAVFLQDLVETVGGAGAAVGTIFGVLTAAILVTFLGEVSVVGAMGV